MNKQAQPLQAIRDGINRLDAELIDILAQRKALAAEVASTKHANGESIRDLDREQELLNRAISEGRKRDLKPQLVLDIFHRIIDDSVRQQYAQYLRDEINPNANAVQSIAHLGDRYSYSHLAAEQHFAPSGQALAGQPCDNFREVFAKVSAGDADFGIVPVENTTSGPLTEIHDLLKEFDLSIIGEEKYAVRHCLVANPGASLESISTVYSHPQAIAQCGALFRRQPSLKSGFRSSTSSAANHVSRDGGLNIAAIACREAAQECGLEVLLEDIGNAQENFTRFIVLAANAIDVPAEIPAKMSAIIATDQKPGALLDALQVFKSHNMNLTKLTSRPIPHKPWQEMFYLDFQGNPAIDKVADALRELASVTSYLRLLGCYPEHGVEATKVKLLNGADKSSANEVKKSGESAREVKKKVDKAYSRDFQESDTIIRVGNVSIGGDGFIVMAGPCSVESENQINSCAEHAGELDVEILRGGCFKPRTSPYSFQGLGLEGLKLLATAGKNNGMPIITELMDTRYLNEVAKGSDIIQIGARNMQNFSLLKAVGTVDRPVMLKRGLMASLDELLNAAEYILAGGNKQVILCERGIRTFETATRNTLDLSAVPVLKELTHLPIIVDPSHAVGRRHLVAPMARAAKAVGAHGIMVEFHPCPEEALSDGPQALRFEQMADLMRSLKG